MLYSGRVYPFPHPPSLYPLQHLFADVRGYFFLAAQKRAAIKDEERRRDLHARGFHHERGGYHEKVLGQFQARSLEARTQGQSLRFLTQPTGILNGDEDEYNQAQWEMTHMQQQNGGATAAGSSSSAGRTGSAGSSKNRGGQQQHDGSTLRSQSVSQQSGGGDSSIGAMRTFSHSTEINTNDML